MQIRSSQPSGAYKRAVPKPNAPKRNVSLAVLLMAIPLLVLIVAIAILLYALFRNRQQTVYLVSGLKRSYDVQIAGREYHLDPGIVLSATLSGGPVKVEIVEPGMEAPAEEVDLTIPLLNGITTDRIFILNPDRLALIRFEQSQYATATTTAFDGKLEFRTNELLHEFEGVDYVFEEFPDELPLVTGNQKLTKSRVSLESGEDPSLALLYLTVTGGEEAATSYLRRYLDVEPKNEEMLALAPHHLPRQEYLDLVTPQLAAYPPKIGLHEGYIRMMKSSGNANLESEYRALVEAHPESGDLLYLLATVVDDEKESDALLERATMAETFSARAGLEVGARALYRAEFSTAYRYLSAAVRLLPDDREAGYLYGQAALADGRLDEFIALQKAELAKDPSSLSALMPLVYAYARQGKSFLAEDALKDAEPALLASFGEKSLTGIQNDVKNQILLGENKFDEYRLAVSNGTEQLDFTTHLINGDVERAFGQLEEHGTDWGSDYLLVYIVAETRRSSVVNKDALRRAIEDMDLNYPSYGEVVNILRAGTAPSIETLNRLPIVPDEKCIVLAAIGLRYPEIRGEAFTLAEKLNFNPGTQSVLLSNVLNGPR